MIATILRSIIVLALLPVIIPMALVRLAWIKSYEFLLLISSEG